MIIRRSRNSNFTVVPNEPINNRDVSADALALLVYLLSRPDDWKVHVAQLRSRFGYGKDKMQAVVRQLIRHGYIIRQQAREDSSHRFRQFEYVVYDEPQTAKEKPQPENPVAASDDPISEPEPENQAPGFVREIASELEKPQPCFPEPENQAALLNTERYQIPYGDSASSEAGANAPLTLNAMIWKEGRALLQTSGLSELKARNLLGKWCKRAPSEEKKKILLAAIRAAVKAGTSDPVSYIEAAIKTELPAPPNPKEFTRDRWALNVETAIKFREWASEWGPRPGRPGCLMPRDLQTAQLVAAIQKQAA